MPRPGATRSSAAACSPSSETRPRRHVGERAMAGRATRPGPVPLACGGLRTPSRTLRLRRALRPMKRVLIANRGEIALRIVRACHEEGLEAVAVYSAADRSSPYARAADHAIAIGPAPPTQSYLNIPRLIEAAISAEADAVHPGYGFLAERAAFA